MGDVSKLKARIDAEFSELDDKIKHAQSEAVETHNARQDRLRDFERRLDALADIWTPRLEALVDRFKDRAQVTPHIVSSAHEASFVFQSELARTRLRFSATTDHDVRKLILSYDLEIVPALMEFEAHQQTEFALDAVDELAIESWLDDRIIEFVQAYLSLHENEYYLKEHMVVDPIAGVRFPSFAAAARLEWEGKEYHFMGDDTRRQFEQLHNIASR